MHSTHSCAASGSDLEARSRTQMRSCVRATLLACLVVGLGSGCPSAPTESEHDGGMEGVPDVSRPWEPVVDAGESEPDGGADGIPDASSVFSRCTDGPMVVAEDSGGLVALGLTGISASAEWVVLAQSATERFLLRVDADGHTTARLVLGPSGGLDAPAVLSGLGRSVVVADSTGLTLVEVAGGLVAHDRLPLSVVLGTLSPSLTHDAVYAITTGGALARVTEVFAAGSHLAVTEAPLPFDSAELTTAVPGEDGAIALDARTSTWTARVVRSPGGASQTFYSFSLEMGDRALVHLAPVSWDRDYLALTVRDSAPRLVEEFDLRSAESPTRSFETGLGGSLRARLISDRERNTAFVIYTAPGPSAVELHVHRGSEWQPVVVVGSTRSGAFVDALVWTRAGGRVGALFGLDATAARRERMLAIRCDGPID